MILINHLIIVHWFPLKILFKSLLKWIHFHFFYMNIRSCRQNFSQLQLFLSTVLFKFTVIILTETWLSESSDLLCEVDGYNSFATHRNNHGGGIKIFVRDSISINIINEMSFINDLYESLTCEIFLFSKKYIINSIYRPPHTSIIRFNEHFQENILSKFPATSNSIICGDFNLNLFILLTTSFLCYSLIILPL